MLRYYYGLVPDDPLPTGTRELGTNVHTALEGLYGYSLDPLAVLQLIYGAAIESHPEYEDKIKADWDLATAMVQGYQEQVISENWDADLRVVGTEQELRVPLPGVDGVDLRGQLDQIVMEVSSGLLRFLDFKTAASFEAHTILELNRQFRTYSVLLHLHHGTVPGQPAPDGVPVVMGGIIRTLRRTKRTERAKPPFYATDPINYNPEQLDATLRRIQWVCTQIRELRAALDAAGGDLATFNRIQRSMAGPVPMPSDCSWRCEASKGLCVAMDDGSDWVGMAFRSGRWKQDDPYAHYERRGITALRQKLGTQLAG
jgi:hypothetical protein